MTDPLPLGERLKRARAGAGLTQVEAAAKLGWDSVTVSRYERGARAPRREQLLAMADAYGLTVDQLLGRADVTRDSPTMAGISAATVESGPAAALYWAVAEMMETCTRISREAARLAGGAPASERRAPSQAIVPASADPNAHPEIAARSPRARRHG